MSASARFQDTLQRGLNALLSTPLAGGLAWPHGPHRFVETFAPTWSLASVRARIVDIRYETEDTVTLVLAPNARWSGFRAGQYVRLGVDVDGVRRTRCFSVSSSAHGPRERLTVTIRENRGGVVSSFLVRRAQRGMVVELSPAEGSFALPEQRPERILLLGGGSGITPLMSMLRTLHDEFYEGRITLLYYARTPEDIIFGAELRALRHAWPRAEFHPITESGSPGALEGRFCAEHVDALVPDAASCATFACGPQGMLDAVQNLWDARGWGDRLHMERFVAPAAPARDADGDAGGAVRFSRANVVALPAAGTLLERAEAAGLNPESGCRMGICHTCKCRKTSGTVRNLLTGAVSAEADEEIQLCVSVPVGDVTLDL